MPELPGNHRHQCEECKGHWECYIRDSDCPILSGKWKHTRCHSCLSKPEPKTETQPDDQRKRRTPRARA